MCWDLKGKGDTEAPQRRKYRTQLPSKAEEQGRGQITAGGVLEKGWKSEPEGWRCAGAEAGGGEPSQDPGLPLGWAAALATLPDWDAHRTEQVRLPLQPRSLL